MAAVAEITESAGRVEDKGPEIRVRFLIYLLEAAMPRATSERFSRAHQPSAKSNVSKNLGEASSSSVRNPIFNTERFGQHILKNPSIAQEYVPVF